MILINEIKGRMRAKGITHKKLSKELGMSPKTLSNKFKKGIFGSDEIEIMIKILDIAQPIDIFFNDNVT
ncbi:DUF739 domain-containing protein [uncultured Clostridium sp.]|uniref:DUF739 domain-containing protein n=1 Tax=uncultured Clostridium sp. TaxID=59620 RepID=UPI002586D84F|nr:DUF739 domain-containing protein [uncultured Clostridium sp.]